MAQTGRVYPSAPEFNSAPPPPGSYYKVNEQHLPVPATYQRGRRGRGGCCCVSTCLCSIFAIVVILLGTAVLVFWLVAQPRVPKFDVENVYVSGLTGTTSTINTNITFELLARNPNKRISIYYDDIYVTMEANGQTIGKGIIPAFHQGHKNTTSLNGEISSENLTLNSDTLSLFISNPSNVPLYAKADVKVRIKAGSIKSPKIKVRVRCDLNVDLTVDIGSQLKSRHCKVKW